MKQLLRREAKDVILAELLPGGRFHTTVQKETTGVQGYVIVVSGN